MKRKGHIDVAENITKAISDDNLTILKAFYDTSKQYQDRLPAPTKDNIHETANALIDYEPLRNEFLNTLINKIGLTKIESLNWNNKLKEFKRGFLEYGDTVEHIYIDLLQAFEFDPDTAWINWMKINKPDVTAIYHRINRQNYYKVTILLTQLRRAFHSSNGLADLVNGIINSLYVSNEVDEFLLTKQVLVEALQKGYFGSVNVGALDTLEDIQKFVIQLRADVSTLEFVSPNYNSMYKNAATPIEDMVIFLTPKINAQVDVLLNAGAFNPEFVQFLARRVVIDNFNGLDDVQAVLVDRRFFAIWDTTIEFTDAFNPEGLYWNYWYHRHGIFSSNRFSQGIVYTNGEAAITGLEIYPKSYTVQRGGSVQFITIATGAHFPPSTATYEVEGATSTNTRFLSGGLLVVGKDEKATSDPDTPALEITATSTVNTDIKVTATVMVI